MGKITALTVQEKRKDRCNLFIDDEFFCGLTVEVAYKNGLKVGKEIDTKELAEIVKESERSDAMTKGLAYVTKTLKTKRQVKEYLQRKGYDEEIIWEVIDKLKEYNYIDDKEYSKRYIESTSKTQGKRLIEYKLMQKGVRKEDISSASMEAEVSHFDNAKLLAEKYMRNKEHTRENYAKVYKYLIGRGFSYDEADFATREFKYEE